MDNNNELLVKILQKLEKIDDTQLVIIQLQTDLREMRGEMRAMCSEVAQMASSMRELRDDMDKTRGNIGQVHLRMDRMQQELNDVKQLAARAIQAVEKDISEKIRQIYDNQISIIEERKLLVKILKDTESLESEVWTLKLISKEHTRAIQKLQASLTPKP